MYYMYDIANGFHNTQATLRVRVGYPVSRRAMRRAWRKLCPSPDDCTCWYSPASNPREGQHVGVPGHPEVHLIPTSDVPAHLLMPGLSDPSDPDQWTCVLIGPNGPRGANLQGTILERTPTSPADDASDEAQITAE